MNSKNIALPFLPFCVCAFVTWSALEFPAASFAQSTPAPTCTVTPSPTPTAVPLPTCTPCASATPPTSWPNPYVEIPLLYQPPNGTRLAWVRYPPPGPNPTPAPGIVLIHGGGWSSGNAHQIGWVAQDIAAAGYYVVNVEYELARCGYIVDQPCHEDDDPTPGSMVTRQINDIKAIINALRGDTEHVDPTKIGVVGGSAGATLAAYVALDTTDTHEAWPFWNAAARPQCAVMLSAAYDFSDMTPPPGHAEIDFSFLLGTQNFVNSSDLAILKSYSPVTLVTTTNTNPFVPLYMINTQYDSPPPYHQIVDMICKLRSVGVPDSAYQTLTVPDSDLHSFGYWDSWDGRMDPPVTVAADVIQFLNAHLK